MFVRKVPIRLGVLVLKKGTQQITEKKEKKEKIESKKEGTREEKNERKNIDRSEE